MVLFFHEISDEQTGKFGDVSDYLTSYAVNASHPLRSESMKRIGYIHKSYAKKEICEVNPHASIEKFPLSPIVNADAHFKLVFDGRQVGRPDGKMESVINLGGHNAISGDPNSVEASKFGIIHYHFRCVEIEVENCRRVLERHNFIEPRDTDAKAKMKLLQLIGWENEARRDICDLSLSDVRINVASVHKVVAYLRWLYCPDRVKKEYYPVTNQTSSNEYLINTLNVAKKKYGL